MKLDAWLPDESAQQSSGGCCGDLRRVTAEARRRGLGRMALDLALEVALVFTVLKVYNIVRNQFGSVVVEPAVAHRHALKVGRFGHLCCCCSRCVCVLQDLQGKML